MSGSTFLTIFVIVALYMFVGMYIGKRYYERRHGVYKKVINGGADVVFSSVFPISFLWPALLLIPSFRNPELCKHRRHVLARDAARMDYEQYQAALQRDGR